MRCRAHALSAAGDQLCASTVEWNENLLDNLSTESDPEDCLEMYMGAVASAGRPGLFCFQVNTRLAGDLGARKTSIVFDTVQAKLYQLDAFMDERECGSHTVLWKNCTYLSDETGFIETKRL